ncbi:MAG: cytosine deaminase [Verrucomicrobiota bacterium]
MTATLYKNAQVPSALLSIPVEGIAEPSTVCDIVVAEGRIIEIAEPCSVNRTDVTVVDLDQRIVFPGFLDAHVHIDKAFSWERAPNVRGEFWDAIELLGKDKDNWTAEDLYQRGTFALRCAEANGTVAIRTHVDTWIGGGEVSHAAMQTLREEWSGRIQLQTVSLAGIDQYMEPGGRRMAEFTMSYPDSLLGGMPQMNPDLDQQLDYFFDLAAEYGAAVDLHVDENGNPYAECLRKVAETVLRKEFPHPVTCGHVCSLAVQDPERALSTLQLVKEAGIQIISLPMCNLYLQGRPAESGRRGTPRWRGVTLLHEMIEAEIPFACASDNVRDAFYAWGDFDMFEVFTQSIRIAHLDTEMDAACRAVTASAADIMGLKNFGSIEVGADARLVAFDSRTFNELLSRPTQSRQLLGFNSAAGKSPDYSELGELKRV